MPNKKRFIKGYEAPVGKKLPACKAALDASTAEEPYCTNETEHGHNSVGPQESLEEAAGTGSSGVLKMKLVHDRQRNGDRRHTVNPNLSTDSLVMQTAINALLKIQKVTRRVRKLL